MIKHFKLFIPAFFIFSSIISFADIIYKKDGSQIEATVINEDDEGITIEINGKQTKLLWNEINSVKKTKIKSTTNVGLKIQPWQKSVTIGLQGFSMLSDNMSNNTISTSVGYWPHRKFEFGVSIETNMSYSKLEDIESNSTITTYTLYLKFYPFPNQKVYVDWLEGRTKTNPLKIRYYMGIQFGTIQAQQKSGNFSSTSSKNSYKIDLLGINWAVKPNVSLNFNLMSFDLSNYNPEETDSEAIMTSSLGVRFLIPVEKKQK